MSRLCWLPLLLSAVLLGCRPSSESQRAARVTPEALPQAARQSVGLGRDTLHVIDTYARGEGPSGSFETRVASAYGGPMRFEQVSPRGTRFVAGVDADGAWTFDAEAGQRVAADAATHAFLRGHELHLLALHPVVRFGPPTQHDTVRFAGQDAHRLVFRDGLGGPLHWYAAVDGKRPLGLMQTNHTGRGAREITVLFDAWQPVGGLELFTEATFLQGDDRYHYTYTHIDLDPVADSVFVQPGEAEL